MFPAATTVLEWWLCLLQDRSGIASRTRWSQQRGFCRKKVWIRDVIRSLCEAARSYDIRLRRDFDYELSLFSAQDLISASRRCLLITSVTEFHAILPARTVGKRNDVSVIHLKHGPQRSSFNACRRDWVCKKGIPNSQLVPLPQSE
jgi:hypothetical protein